MTAAAGGLHEARLIAIVGSFVAAGCGGAGAITTLNTPSPSTPAAVAGNYTLAMRNSSSCPTLSVSWPVQIIQTSIALAALDNDKTPSASHNYVLGDGGQLGSVSSSTVTLEHRHDLHDQSDWQHIMEGDWQIHRDSLLRSHDLRHVERYFQRWSERLHCH